MQNTISFAKSLRRRSKKMNADKIINLFDEIRSNKNFVFEINSASDYLEALSLLQSLIENDLDHNCKLIKIISNSIKQWEAIIYKDNFDYECSMLDYKSSVFYLIQDQYKLDVSILSEILGSKKDAIKIVNDPMRLNDSHINLITSFLNLPASIFGDKP